jgi:hypothetical protein
MPAGAFRHVPEGVTAAECNAPRSGAHLRMLLGATSISVVPDPAEAADLLDSTAIVLLSLGVLVLIVFAIWLGRELLASRLSVRMLAENQRLSRREQQHQKALEKERGQHRPPVRKLQSAKVRRTHEPPPLPQPADWSDSHLRTEVRSDLPPDEAEMRAAEIEERLLDPTASTVEFPLVAGDKRATNVWPWPKRPGEPGDDSD